MNGEDQTLRAANHASINVELVEWRVKPPAWVACIIQKNQGNIRDVNARELF